MIEIVMWLIHIWDTLIYMRDTCAHVRQIIVISQTPSSNCHELYHVSVTNWDTLIHMWDTYWLKGHSCMWETWRQWMHHVTHMDECLTWRCLSHVTIMTCDTYVRDTLGDIHGRDTLGDIHGRDTLGDTHACERQENSRCIMSLTWIRTRSFLETGFWPLYPSCVWFVPLSRSKRVFLISTRTRPRS